MENLTQHIKETDERLREIIHTMRAANTYDHSWLSIAETHFNDGIKALIRAIPKSYLTEAT